MSGAQESKIVAIGAPKAEALREVFAEPEILESLDNYCDADGNYLQFQNITQIQTMGIFSPRFLVYLVLSLVFDGIGKIVQSPLFDGVIGKYFRAPLIEEGASYFLGKFRAPNLTYHDRYIIKVLSEQTQSFQEGMDYLMKRHKMGASEAFRHLIRFILSRREISLKEIDQDPSVIDGYYSLSDSDIEVLEKEYGLTLEEMDRLIAEASHDIFLSEEMGLELRRPILELLHRREGILSQNEVQEALDGTQRSVARLKGRLHRTRGEVTRGVLRAMIESLEPLMENYERSGSIPDHIHLVLGTLEPIVLSMEKIPEGERLKKLHRYLDSWRQMVATVESQGGLHPDDARIILSLSGEYPSIERFKNLSGGVLEEEIEAAGRGIEFLLEAVDLGNPLAMARKRFLQRLSESPGGVLGYHLDGTAHVVLWAPTMKIYSPDASRVGPYTFHESAVAWINGKGEIRYEPALAFIDRRDRPGLITVGEMQSLLDLENSLRQRAGDLPEGEAISQAFERFMTDLKRAWTSIEWKDDRARIDLGKDPRKKIQRDAVRMRELSAGYELIREVRRVSKELLEARVYESWSNEQIWKGMASVTKRFESFFAEGSRNIFVEKMGQIAEAILEGEEGNVLSRRAELKDIIFGEMDARSGQELGRLAGNVKTIAFGEEVRDWVKVAEAGLRKTPMPLLKRLTLMRANQGLPPSLKEARKLFAEERYPEALHEYGRIAIDGRTEISTRMRALVELFRAAYFVDDIDWMNKALGELDYLLAPGHWSLKDEEKQIMRLALRLEETGLITLGKSLKKALLRDGTDGGNDSGGGGPPIVNRSGDVNSRSAAPIVRVVETVYGTDITDRLGISRESSVEELKIRLREALEAKGRGRSVETEMREYRKTHDLSDAQEIAVLIEAFLSDGERNPQENVGRALDRLDRLHSRLEPDRWVERRRGRESRGRVETFGSRSDLARVLEGSMKSARGGR